MTKKAPKAAPKKAAPAVKPSAAPTATTDASKIAKTQIVEGMAEKSGLTKKQSDEAFTAALDAILEAVKGGKSVGLPGLGTLSVKATAARTGVRPGTSERIQIPAGKKVAFKVATTLKGTI